MGRAEGTFKNSLMTTSEIASHLLGNCGSLEQFEVYMFGSALRGIGEDIDILVVGPAGDALSKLKRELRAASEFLPLHILCMQPSEERRTDFVVREGCVQLKKLARCRRKVTEQTVAECVLH